jgi:hypothetical protein
LLAALLASSTAAAQNNRAETIANIPFPFTVANRTLPAGRYTIIHMNDTTLRIFGSHNQGTVVLSTTVEGKAPENSGRIVFHRYGASYFLSEVWVPASGTGRKVFRSRTEEEMAGRQAEMEIAILRIAR